MTTDQFFWVLARVSGLGSYAALAMPSLHRQVELGGLQT